MNLKEADELERIAYHEAGHAVIAYRHGREVTKRGITFERDSLKRLLGGRAHLKGTMPNSIAARSLGYGGEVFERIMYERVTAQVEILQAGFLSEINRNWDGSELVRSPEQTAEEIMKWVQCGSARRRNRLCRGGLDDLSGAVLLLLSARQAKVGREELTEDDGCAVLCEYHNGQSRMLQILRRQRTWRAIDALAKILLERGHLEAKDANRIIDAARPPRASHNWALDEGD